MQPINKLIVFLKSNQSAFNHFRNVNQRICAFLFTLSPFLLVHYRYYIARGKFPNLKTPQTFDEKLLWLMLYDRDPLKSKCADKYGLRSYVEEKGLGHILPTLVGVYERVEDIEFEYLPDRFVLKCTHGSGSNIICKDKKKLNIGNAKRDLQRWMKLDISKIAGEIHYASIKSKIICENFLDDMVNEVPVDYKIYCFAGKVHCTMACTDRGYGRNPNIDFYDKEWKNKLHYFKDSKITNRSRKIPKPPSYEEMVGYAEHLSKPFNFVRMDFYEIQGKVVIGEMTFTPNGCIDLDYTDEAQTLLGEMIQFSPQLS